MALVVVERKLEAPVTREQLAQLHELHGWCYETNDVKWLQSLLSDDGVSVICLFDAPDLEAVRRANKLAKTPAHRFWAADKLL